MFGAAAVGDGSIAVSVFGMSIGDDGGSWPSAGRSWWWPLFPLSILLLLLFGRRCDRRCFGAGG